MKSLFERMSEPAAHARRTDPGTSHEAARAVTPGITELQAVVERYALERGPEGFTDAAMSDALDDASSTFRTRRSELTVRGIILDSGRRAKHGDSDRNRIVWVHRSFVPGATPGNDWLPNPGHCPEAAKGKRVKVILAHGREGSYDPNPMSPPGWAADGKGGCSWIRRGMAFDIEWYRVL